MNHDFKMHEQRDLLLINNKVYTDSGYKGINKTANHANPPSPHQEEQEKTFEILAKAL